MNRLKKIGFWVGIVALVILLLVAENLWIISICEHMLSEENWLQIPVTASDGKAQKEVGLFIMSDKTGDFIYKDKGGTSFYNDWNQISLDVAKAKVKSAVKPAPKPKAPQK